MAHGSSSSLQQLSIVGRLKGSHAGQQTMEGEGLCGTEKTKGVQIHIEGGYSSGGNHRGLGYSPMEERLASICVSLRTKAKKQPSKHITNSSGKTQSTSSSRALCMLREFSNPGLHPQQILQAIERTGWVGNLCISFKVLAAGWTMARRQKLVMLERQHKTNMKQEGHKTECHWC